MKKLLLIAFMTMALSGVHASDITTTQIDGNTYSVDTLAHFKAGPGSYYTAIKFQGPSLTFRTFYLEVDMKQPDVEFRTELGRDSVIGCENISNHALRKSVDGEVYYAAVNGDFFATSGDIGTPVNGSLHNGMLGTVASGSPHFFFDTNMNAYASYVSAANTYSVNGGEAQIIDNVNARIGTDQIILFNSANGRYTHTPSGTTEVVLDLNAGESWLVNNAIKAKVVAAASTAGNSRIPEGQAVLSASGSKAGSITSLKVGDEVEISLSMKLSQFNNAAPKLSQMVGGNVIFLQGGNTTPQGDYARHPRTMLGYNQDQTKMIFAVVDGRSTISSGATYVELADLMKWVGAWDAINIDGGGSSSMFLPQFGAMNYPSDGKERAVGNGVYCVLKAPEDNAIAEIRFVDWSMKFPKYGIYTPKFYGYNKYGILIDTDVEGVTLSCDATIGEVTNEGKTFYGTGSGIGALKATYNGLEATIPVVVETSDNVALRLQNVVIDGSREYPVEVQALVNEDYMPMSPTALSWISSDPEVATIGASDGVLKGVKEGETTVTGTLGDFTGTLNVKVEIPTSEVMPVVEAVSATEWKLSQLGGTGISISGLDKGFALNYTGNGSGRGAYITAERTSRIWSLPEKIRIRINPGISSVTKLSLNISNALGANEPSWAICGTELPKEQESVIEASLSDIFDTSDIGIYPITINSIRLDMNKSEKGKEFEIQVPGFEAVYSAGSGIGSLPAANAARVYPNPVASGAAVTVESDGAAAVTVYTLGGTQVMSAATEGRGEISTAGLLPGMYVVKVTTTDATATAKLIVK